MAYRIYVHVLCFSCRYFALPTPYCFIFYGVCHVRNSIKKCFCLCDGITRCTLYFICATSFYSKSNAKTGRFGSCISNAERNRNLDSCRRARNAGHFYRNIGCRYSQSLYTSRLTGVVRRNAVNTVLFRRRLDKP